MLCYPTSQLSDRRSPFSPQPIASAGRGATGLLAGEAPIASIYLNRSSQPIALVHTVITDRWMNSSGLPIAFCTATTDRCWDLAVLPIASSTCLNRSPDGLLGMIDRSHLRVQELCAEPANGSGQRFSGSLPLSKRIREIRCTRIMGRRAVERQRRRPCSERQN